MKISRFAYPCGDGETRFLRFDQNDFRVFDYVNLFLIQVLEALEK